MEQSVGKRQQLKIEDQYELSGGNDYVRRWLAQTQKEVPREPPREPRAGTQYIELLANAHTNISSKSRSY